MNAITPIFNTANAFASSAASDHQDAIRAAMKASIQDDARVRNKRVTPAMPSRTKFSGTSSDLRAVFWRKGRQAYVPLTFDEVVKATRLSEREAASLMRRSVLQGVLTSISYNGSEGQETVYEVLADAARKGGQ